MKMRLRIVVPAVVLGALMGLPAQAQQAFSAPGAFLGNGAGGGGGQMHAQGAFRGGAAGGRYARSRSGGRGGYHHRGGFYRRGGYYNRAGFIGAPYFYPPDYFSGYYDETPETEAPRPQVIILQTPAASIQAPPPSPVDPLLLELHGNHWVRIKDSGESEVGSETSHPGSSQTSSRRSAEAESPLPVRALPPAALVFRDGHQEQTKKYTIIGPIIYTSTNYWAGGSWTRRIPIAELDVPATLRLNQERGVRFDLPSAPNVVVVRP